MIIAGIDEAGLGPVLGPLVVSATAFELTAEIADKSLWELLSPCVCRKLPKRPTRIAVADSKKLYHGLKEGGVEHLERGVLTMLASGADTLSARIAGVPPADSCDSTSFCPTGLRQLLSAVSPAALQHIGKYVFYSHTDLPLPRAVSQTSIDLFANALGLRMDRVGVGRPVAMRSEVIFEGEFNRLIAATDNKSVMLFDVTARLLAHLWNLSAGKDCRIFVDRQGGRMRYLPSLQRIFEGARFKILDESENVSSYRIEDGSRTVEIHFQVGAEDQNLNVALASMLSKYLRELLMELFNDFWRQRVPGLAPTAGYHVDGQRFFSEIEPHLQALGVEQAMLYRSR